MVGREWLRKKRQIARALKDTVVHRRLGDHLFHEDFWAPRRSAVAKGLALGLFIAFTPTIPFQMLLAATAAYLVKANLPAAVAGVWATNPLTALPIYLSANRLGRFLLHDTWLLNLIHELFVAESRSAFFFDQTLCLWTGSLMMAGLAALLGWALVHLLWSLVG